MSEHPTFARIDSDNNVGANTNTNTNTNNNGGDNEDNDSDATEFDPWVTGALVGGPGNPTDAQTEAWRERERRSRSVRSMMMFMIMLMLMDGEEQSQYQRRQRQQQANTGGLRGGGGTNHNKSERVVGDTNGIFSDMELYSARRMQDRSIEDIVVSGNHPRVNALIERNDGRDVDGEIRTWAQQQRIIQTRVFYERVFKDLVLEQSDGSFVKVLVGSQPTDVDTKIGAQTKKKNVVDSISSEENKHGDLRSAIRTFDEFEDTEQEVWHYPWNATGFYRGDWMESSSLSSSSSPKSTILFPSNSTKFLTPAEAEIPLLDLVRDQADSTIGVCLLPPGMELMKVPHNNTDTKQTQDVSTTFRTTRTRENNSRRVNGDGNDNIDDNPFSLRGSPSTTKTTMLPEKISLTKNSGKVVLQLYSKSVPAMKELSLIEGVVKLYDSQSIGYSTRRDILLRVHGVLIHSLGRLSLIANPKSTGRAALVIRSSNASKDQYTNTKNTNDETDRRKLQELLSTSSSITNNFDDQRMDEIRDRALNLFYDRVHLVDYDRAGSSENRDGDGPSILSVENEYLSSPQILYKEGNARDSTTKIIEERYQNRRRLEEVVAANNITKDLRHDNEYVNHNKTTSRNFSKHVIPFPFVWDDEEQSLRQTHIPASVRSIPLREQHLEVNSGSCEFLLNMMVQEEQWTIGEWRKLIYKHIENEIGDPSLASHVGGNHYQTAVNETRQKNSLKDKSLKKRQRSPFSEKKKRSLQQSGMEQAWVMTLNGTIVSPNCNFSARINTTAIRTDWEKTTGKAINYSFYMMTICLTQIVLLLRQLLHTQAQSAATRVSLLCIGWQTVVDALLCLVHIYLSLAMQPLFTAFASVAFFKLLIFCVIEMKYMAIIIQARNASNGGNTIELLRRQIGMLHLRFYVALMGSCLGFFHSNDMYRTPYILILYSFWVPQIVQNIVTEAKKPLHTYYIYGMSITRLFAPMYIFAVDGNFLKEVYPEAPTNIFMCQLLFLWVGIQALVLDAQSRYGARFLIPSQFLPPKYDYNRPIPPSLLSSENESTNPSEQLQRERDVPKTEIRSVVVTKRDLSPRGGGPRNRKEGNKINRGESMTTETVTAVPQNLSTCIECVICYNDIDTSNYMIAPCDHIFHRDCLVQWMEVKMECPICRNQLPAL